MKGYIHFHPAFYARSRFCEQNNEHEMKIMAH
ncbi:hypothetical protein VCA_000860 [Vibrio albensis VL426]|nr:hypothetical protein VCA_000860 [Vibrio cholerae VL426]